jgi:hypothetical protein
MFVCYVRINTLCSYLPEVLVSFPMRRVVDDGNDKLKFSTTA